MKLFHFSVLIACVIVFASCTKKTEKKAPPPPVDTWTPYTVPPQPALKLTRLTERRPGTNGVLDTYTIEFRYDDKDRLTLARRLEDDLVFADYHYRGEEFAKEVVHNYDGSVAEYDSCVTFSRNADTVNFTYVQEHRSDRDIYLFRDSALYKWEMFANPFNEDWRASTQVVWAYSSDMNLQQVTHIIPGGERIVRARILATDTRKNPLRDLTFFLFRVVDFESTFMSGMGTNNATRIQFENGNIWDIQYTYNNEGYPVTMTFPNGRTVELEYSR